LTIIIKESAQSMCHAISKVLHVEYYSSLTEHGRK